MSKNIVETEGPQKTSQHGAYTLYAGLARLCARMRMHTDQYVMLIAFPHQQWFRASLLRHTYIAYLVLITHSSLSSTFRVREQIFYLISSILYSFFLFHFL